MATFDAIEILKAELSQPQYAVPPSCVAALAGISSGRMSNYWRGTQRVPNDHDLALRNVWRQLKTLIERVKPIPVSFSQHERLRECIELMERDQLQVIVYAEVNRRD